MYHDIRENQALTEAEVNNILRKSIREALTGQPDYCTVAIIVHSIKQQKAGQQLAQQMAKKLGAKCLRQADRIFFLSMPVIQDDTPLGEIRVFENYLTPEASQRRNYEQPK